VLPVRERQRPDEPLAVIRVASVPAGHVYIQHLSGTGDGVHRLADPPVVGAPDLSQWWPPRMLDPDWAWKHRAHYDVFHVHFGFDAMDTATLSRLIDVLRAADKPLIYTVHDLRNPHHADPRRHNEHLDVLVPAADAVLTLTPGAATVIASRWCRDVQVIPHPHVVELDRLRHPRLRREPTDGFVVGVHAKSVRPSMDPLPVIRVIAETVRDLPDAQLRVNVHRDAMDPASRNYQPELHDYLVAADLGCELTLDVHDCFSDEELWAYLSDLSVSVLPYRFGTHSGWLEACRDLGTVVIAPDCGFYAEQQPCLSYDQNEQRLDVDSLVRAVTQAYDTRPVWRSTFLERQTQRQELATVHRDVYERLLR
jgi:glycosyltransferase involved in cell wall biosynthesis